MRHRSARGVGAFWLQQRLLDHPGIAGGPCDRIPAHGIFVGGLWASGRLHPGGVDVAAGWREQLAHDVAPLLSDHHPVWLHADNAYYRVDLIRFCRERGWDYSISVTNDGYRRPILESLEGLPESAWTDIGGEETEPYRLSRRLIGLSQAAFLT